MTPTILQRKLLAGEPVTGHFFPAGESRFQTAGILTWSKTDGALIDLVDAGDPWPPAFNVPLTVHGLPDDGEPVTLLDARIRKVSMVDQVRRVGSFSLALGEHIGEADVWPHAGYRTASLLGWAPENGFEFDRKDEGRTVHFTWRAPAERIVHFGDVEVRLAPGSEWAVSDSPDWSFANTLTLAVKPPEPWTIGEFMGQIGAPLLDFFTFARDKPDAITYEVYFDPPNRRKIVMLRTSARQVPSPGSFYPGEGEYLFQADDLADVAGALESWHALWHRTKPSIWTFCSTINDPGPFSPARFLTLYSAAEGYWRKTNELGEQWRIQRLVNRAGVDPKVVGASTDAVALIGASRQYHAHMTVGTRFSEEQMADQTFESTRRLHAILQACLLSEIGVGPEVASELLNAHYANWQIP